jgi:hypothetical protein
VYKADGNFITISRCLGSIKKGNIVGREPRDSKLELVTLINVYGKPVV